MGHSIGYGSTYEDGNDQLTGIGVFDAEMCQGVGFCQDVYSWVTGKVVKYRPLRIIIYYHQDESYDLEIKRTIKQPKIKPGSIRRKIFRSDKPISVVLDRTSYDIREFRMRALEELSQNPNFAGIRKIYRGYYGLRHREGFDPIKYKKSNHSKLRNHEWGESLLKFNPDINDFEGFMLGRSAIINNNGTFPGSYAYFDATTLDGKRMLIKSNFHMEEVCTSRLRYYGFSKALTDFPEDVSTVEEIWELIKDLEIVDYNKYSESRKGSLQE